MSWLVFLIWVVGLFAKQDVFIENIFEVKIPGLKGAYNPSIVEYGEGYLMAFRYDTYKEPIGYSNVNDYCQFIGLVRLDKDFSPVGAWQPCLGKRSYDPRLFKWNGAVFMTFAAAGVKDPNSMLSSTLNLCSLHECGDQFIVSCQVSLRVPFQMTWEKNWVPFIYNGDLLFEYMISPRRIIQPVGEKGRCEELIFDHDNQRVIKWLYGPIRGGTPAIDIGDKYLGFFHSHIENPKNKKLKYFIGAYTFLKEPPFFIDSISKVPFSHPDFYSTPKNAKTQSQVLFPGGFIMKEGKIYLCYGENDDAIKIMVIDQKKLFSSMRKY